MDKVTTTYFARLKCRTIRENKDSSKPSWNAINNPPKGHTRNRSYVFCALSKYFICHIISSKVESSEQILFYSDGSAFIADNSANAQIFSEEVFSDKIDHIIFNGVENIVGKGIITKNIGTGRSSCTDDEVQLHTKKLYNILYFPYLSVNILSATELDESMKDDEGTWLLTNSK